MTDNTNREPAKSSALLLPGDLRKFGVVGVGAGLALFVPSRYWLRLSRHVAALTGGSSSAVESVTSRIPKAMIAAIEAQGCTAAEAVQANHLVESAQVIRHYLPWRWRPRLTLTGREHLDTALEGQRGAILWVANFASSNLVSKMALSGAGYRVTHVSRTGHPHSNSRLGRGVLNRPQVGVEMRYLSGGRILLDEGSDWLRRAYAILERNEMVSITAGTAASRVAQVPFLDGTLTIALGPPHFSATSGAALLPVFSVESTPDAYEVCLGAPLPMAVDRDFEAPARAFAERLEPYVRRHPEQWQGWDAYTPAVPDFGVTT